MTKPLSLHNILATLLTMTALFAGQNAWAQNPPTIGNITYNTEGGYYEINDTLDLADLAYHVNHGLNCSGLTFKMTADLNFHPTTEWDDDTSTEDNFTAIGFIPAIGFGGTFDGDGHTISGIRIYKPNAHYQGLFGCSANGGIIKNVTIIKARITGLNYVGGIVGQNSGTVENCHVKAIVNGNDYIGGIVGDNLKNISNCLAIGATANASNSGNAGAILGIDENTNSNLTSNYYYSCTVNGSKIYVGCGKYTNGNGQIQQGDIAENNGAVPCYKIDLEDGCTATSEGIFTFSGTPYACEGLTIVLNCTPPQGLNLNGFTVTSATVTESNGTYTFVMPATNVTVNAIFRSTEQAFPVTYIDQYGNIKQCNAVALSNNITDLIAEYGKYYVVNSNVTYNDVPVKISIDSVTLILADGCTMSIGTKNNYSHGIEFSRNNRQTLTIYGQSLGTGYLKIFAGGNSYGIKVGESDNFSTNYYTQCSGNVFIRTIRMPCIYNGYINLYGGTLDVKIETNANPTGLDIDSYKHTIHIYGGKFWARGKGVGCGREGSITLGWTNPTDLIYSKDYKGSGVKKTKNGQTLTDGTNIYSGTLNSGQIKDKTLRPCYTKEIAGYENGNSGWAFISSPVTESILPSEVGNLIGEQIPESTLYDYDLYRFNQSPVVNSEGEYLEWQNYHQHTDDFNLVNGQGYLYASKDTTTLVFTGAFNMAGTQDVPLVYETTNPDTRMHGWNLIGNPFGVEAYVNRPFYKMNTDGTGIVAVENYDNYTTAQTIPACTGIFVKAEGVNDTVTFSTTAPTLSTPNNGNLQITLAQTVTTRDGSSTETLDNAIVSFNEGSQLGKFYFGEQDANLYIPQGSEEYAIVSVGNTGEIPLNFKAKESGEYTITVNPEGVTFGYLHLIDNMTGADVDLVPLCKGGRGDSNTQASYTFTAKTTDYESRFKLVFSTIEDGASTGSAAFAFVSNGNIIITGIADACDASLQVVDVMGRIIRTVGLSQCGSRTTTAGMAPGVYVLRLIQGNDVKTQKIVIE